MNPVISRLLRPPRIEPGKTYPVVLFLHGAGERGTDNEQQLAYLPTGTVEEYDRGNGSRWRCAAIDGVCGRGPRFVVARLSRPAVLDWLFAQRKGMAR